MSVFIESIAMILKCSVFLIALTFVCGERLEIRPPFLPKPDLIIGGKECVKTGYMCEDCEQIAFCFQLPNGEWIKEDAGTCDEGTTCNEKTAQCSRIPDFECDPTLSKYKFICNQVGIFPDAFNCKNYHMCTLASNGEDVVETSVPLSCDEGYGYDPLTTLCKIRLVDDKCQDPLVQPCKNVGESDVIKGNPSLYFTCLPSDVDGERINFPQMFHCKNDFEYINKRCQDPNPSGLDEDGQCEGTGNFYNPDDCRKYIECTGSGKDPIGRSCSSGYRFDSITKNCVLFTC